jgi:plastocyanin
MRLLAPMRAASAVLVVGVVLATPAAVRAEGGGQAVTIHEYQYHPGTSSVAAGTPVTWTNQDSAKHDVATTSGPAAFRSGELSAGQSFTYTFALPGTYQYLCTLHPDMVAALAVTPAPTTTSPPTTAPPAVAPAVAPAVGDTATTVAPAPAPAPATVAVAAPAVVPASVTRDDDLASSARPYLALLAAVAAVVVGSLLLMGVGRRAPES